MDLQHTGKSFDHARPNSTKKIAQMGGLAERLLAQGFDALEQRDPKLAEAAVASDRDIDLIERDLQGRRLMIARRQPMANDLRHVMTVLKIAGDLERIGDLAKNIAKRALAVSGESHPKSLMTGLKHMTELAWPAQGLLDAFAGATPTRRACGAQDERIDADVQFAVPRAAHLHDGRPAQHHACARICCSCAKNIERIGDHATNIAENVLLPGARRGAGRRPAQGRRHELDAEPEG